MHGLDHEIGLVQGRDGADPDLMKPSPYLVRAAVGRFDTVAARCVFVGDSASDVLAGMLAGVPVIGYAPTHARPDPAGSRHTVDGMVMWRVSRRQAVNYRLVVNNLSTRLPAGSYVEAAYVGLQDTAPRDALLGLHARVEACEPTAWQDPCLIQTYSPRAAVYVLPADDSGVFTVGRLPRDLETRQVLEDLAEESCAAMDGQEISTMATVVHPV